VATDMHSLAAKWVMLSPTLQVAYTEWALQHSVLLLPQSTRQMHV